MPNEPFQRSISRRTILGGGVMLAATVTAVVADAPTPARAAMGGSGANPRTPKSVIIGIDGCVFARTRDGHTPNMDRLIASGMLALSNLGAQPLASTVSGPGWSSIATGTWADKHGVTDNTFAGSAYDAYPDYLTRLGTALPTSSTLVVASWDPVAVDIFGPGVSERIGSPNDAATVASVVDRLATGNPDAIMVHLDEPDLAGHRYGAASEEYLAAIEQIDAQVGQLVTAVEMRTTYAEEDWLIVLTTDHGHTPAGGHGGNTIGERGVFVIASGGRVPAGSQRHDVKLVDIAPTVLQHHGAPVQSDWELDGAPLDSLVTDDFDQLRAALLPAVDETVPVGVLGWTRDAPAGWMVDNSNMPAGGTTEWRGWAFTTDEFWTNVALGQGRETSVRNRNVFAVADSDEWDDAPHDAGSFDSTLYTPAYQLNGAGAATLSFATHYQEDPTQTASVFASFDGGEPLEVMSYATSLNRTEHIQVLTPPDATTVRFGFRYVGSNGSFWTIDQVRFNQDKPGIVSPDPDIQEGDEVPPGMLPATGTAPLAAITAAASAVALGVATIFRAQRG